MPALFYRLWIFTMQPQTIDMLAAQSASMVTVTAFSGYNRLRASISDIKLAPETERDSWIGLSAATRAIFRMTWLFWRLIETLMISHPTFP
jgi:hypothetical protein